MIATDKDDRLRRNEWYVIPVSQAVAEAIVEQYHYARAASRSTTRIGNRSILTTCRASPFRHDRLRGMKNEIADPVVWGQGKRGGKTAAVSPAAQDIC